MGGDKESLWSSTLCGTVVKINGKHTEMYLESDVLSFC